MMNSLTRGDIVYVSGDPANPPKGSEIWPDRLGIIVSADVLNRTSGVVMVVYLTTSEKKRLCPTHIPVISSNKQAMAMCEQVHTVDKSRITDHVGRITEDELEDVEAGILFGLQINRGKNPQGIFRKFQHMLDQYPALHEALA